MIDYEQTVSMIKRTNVAEFQQFLAQHPNMTTDEVDYVLSRILNEARYNPNGDAVFAQMIEETIRQYPRLDINKPTAYESTQLFDSVSRASRKSSYPNGLLPCYINSTFAMVYKNYVPCSPLTIAAIYDLTHIANVLLARPEIDLMATENNRLAYAYTKTPTSHCGPLLYPFYMKKFYDEAKQATINQLPALLKKYQDLDLTPMKVCEFIVNEATKSENTEEKLGALTAAIQLTDSQAHTALGKYLRNGITRFFSKQTFNDLLREKLITEKCKIMFPNETPNLHANLCAKQ